MPPKYPQVLDEGRLETARKMLCNVFDIEEVREHQNLAGKNILRGMSTVYDVPTGGGKTLAFWYPLFYHWDTKSDALISQKMVLVVSPLNALMNSQAKALCNWGIPALAVNSEGDKMEDIFENTPGEDDRLKHRVVFVSPETALSNSFHERVLKNKAFRDNCIELVIDEAHCASEWGDDFRTEYGQLGKLLARLPSGLPVLLASATMPEEVIKDILFKVGLTPECERVAVSNAKYNVALSIRILQHPTTTYADLFSLFPTGENEEFPQTIIYVNSRTEAEQIQDFLRRHRPSHMPEDAFEFYHRNITETRKEYIQKGLQSGKLRCVIATDALGMGMDFRSIVRVVLWHEPLSFLSLIQKIGRCVRQLHDIGEAILFITKAAYRKHSVVVEAERESDDEEEAGESTDGIEIDRIAAIDREEAEVAVPQRGRKKKAQSALQARDQMFLSLFIATSKCRREPWDEFFSNQGKMLLFERRPEVRCCDNCQPDKFPVEKIQLSYPFPTRAPRTKRPSEELLNEVTVALRRWRTDVIQRDYPNQSIITGRYILDDEVIDKIAARPRIVTSIEIFRHIIPWGFGIAKYGGAIVELVSSICNLHPDPVQLAHEERERKRLIDEANKEYRETLTQAFKECYDSVHLVGTGRMVKRGPRNNQQLVEELMCQPFLALPRKNVWPLYYEVIQNPISMAQIRNMMLAGPSRGYATLQEFVDAWRLLFSNARTFNEPGSQIYCAADDLEKVFNDQLVLTMGWYNLTITDSDILVE